MTIHATRPALAVHADIVELARGEQATQIFLHQLFVVVPVLAGLDVPQDLGFLDVFVAGDGDAQYESRRIRRRIRGGRVPWETPVPARRASGPAVGGCKDAGGCSFGDCVRYTGAVNARRIWRTVRGVAGTSGQRRHTEPDCPRPNESQECFVTLLHDHALLRPNTRLQSATRCGGDSEIVEGSFAFSTLVRDCGYCRGDKMTRQGTIAPTQSVVQAIVLGTPASVAGGWAA